MSQSHMLVRHVRDTKGKAFATIVAISQKRIGAAVCNAKDTFVKSQGVKIAAGRAKAGKLPPMFANSTKGLLVSLEVGKMEERARKYFKVVRAPKNAKARNEK